MTVAFHPSGRSPGRPDRVLDVEREYTCDHRGDRGDQPERHAEERQPLDRGLGVDGIGSAGGDVDEGHQELAGRPDSTVGGGAVGPHRQPGGAHDRQPRGRRRQEEQDGDRTRGRLADDSEQRGRPRQQRHRRQPATEAGSGGATSGAMCPCRRQTRPDRLERQGEREHDVHDVPAAIEAQQVLRGDRAAPDRLAQVERDDHAPVEAQRERDEAGEQDEAGALERRESWTRHGVLVVARVLVIVVDGVVVGGGNPGGHPGGHSGGHSGSDVGRFGIGGRRRLRRCGVGHVGLAARRLVRDVGGVVDRRVGTGRHEVASMPVRQPRQIVDDGCTRVGFDRGVDVASAPHHLRSRTVRFGERVVGHGGRGCRFVGVRPVGRIDLDDRHDVPRVRTHGRRRVRRACRHGSRRPLLDGIGHRGQPSRCSASGVPQAIEGGGDPLPTGVRSRCDE